MSEAIAGFVGVVLGWVLALLSERAIRMLRTKTHRRALAAHIRVGYDDAKGLLGANVESPLYRLPITGYHTAFPALLADAALTEEEITAITHFFELAETINRGLDNCDEIRKGQGDPTEVTAGLHAEFKRVRLKAETLVSERTNPALDAVAC